MKDQKILVGLIQANAGPNPEQNLERTIQKIGEAAEAGAQIICLQELFKTNYFCQEKENKKLFELAESVPGPTTKKLGALAKKHKVVLIVPLFEKASGKYYNTAAVIDADGSFLGKYRKMHIPNDPGFWEKSYFERGNLGFPVFNTAYGKIGVLICWDQWFPEPARILALQGAKIIFYPTAIGWHEDDPEWFQRMPIGWQAVMQGHAIANNVFVAAANRVGREGTLTFWGRSFVAGPFGEIIKQAGNSEQIITAQCNLGEIEELRVGWPFLRERRKDSFSELSG